MQPPKQAGCAVAEHLRDRTLLTTAPNRLLRNAKFRTRIAASLPLRQYRLNVLTTIKHSDNLGCAVHHAIEYDMWTGRHRPKTRPHLVTRSSSKRIVFKEGDHLADLPAYLVGGVAARNSYVIVPNCIEIGEGLRRPNNRTFRPRHVARSRPEENPRYPIPCRVPQQGIG